MPPSAPVPQQHPHHQPATEPDGIVTSSSMPSSQEYNNDDSWNQSKSITDPDAQRTILTPLIASDANSRRETTAVPQTQVIQQQPPMDTTGMNNMWNANSMIGMNPYNTYNPMNPSNSIYGNYGGFGNNNNAMMNSMMMNFMPPPPMVGAVPGSGPFSTITNYLLGIQNVIMSIGQVVQIISFNASSLQQLCESILAMMEHAIQSWHEQQQPQLPQNHTSRMNHESHDNSVVNGSEEISPEEKQRAIQQQRRLRALRYAITVAVSYIGYTILRKWFLHHQQQQQRYRRELEHSSQSYGNNNMMTAVAPTLHNSYNPSTLPYYNNYTNPYWNTAPPPPTLQQPSLPPSYNQYYNAGSFQ